MQSSAEKPLRWGWLAVIYLKSGGQWVSATEASRLSGVPTANLRRWARRGVISVIHRPGQRRRYYVPELELLEKFEKHRGDLPGLIVLGNHIEVVLASAYDSA
ncbi:hypothetical protein GCM10022254_74030 [Actinomadura meridiana]|uniref:HTH merR-type domain-containing protein n=1 Tax=Actinomadura meridiana TaxID=559626 RepID=A0ABP8CQM4_9ACTN